MPPNQSIFTERTHNPGIRVLVKMPTEGRLTTVRSGIGVGVSEATPVAVNR